MASAEDDVLLELAGRIADGDPIDWEAAMRRHEALQRNLEGLRLVESIADVYRTPAASPSPETAISSLPTDAVGPAPDMQDEGENLGAAPPRWGPLRILRRLDRGGFGEVFLAHDPTLQRDVALKLVRPDRCGSPRDEDRFISEARRLAKVRNENVVVVHGADRHDGRVGLWEDLLDGETLEECLRERGLWRAEQAALDGIDLCRALAAVHRAGLVHRDVKTANVMRTREGRIVLMDFGAACEQTASGPGQDLSGTPLFMAPELLRGGDPGPASDLYSLGVVLYRLVTGRFPIEARSMADLREKSLRGESVPLLDRRPDLPQGFVAVVERALDPDPARRFRSSGELEQALRRFLGRPDEIRRVPWRTLAAVAAVAVLTAGWLAIRAIFPALEADVALIRLRAGTEERIGSGGAVRSGDQIALEFRANRKAHVYVVNEDGGGRATILFPAPGIDATNPLSAGERRRLPGTSGGLPVFWDVGGPGGRETILVVASTAPLKDLEERLAAIPKATAGGGPGGGDDLPGSAAHRGIESFSTHDGRTGARGGPIEEIYTDLSGRSGVKAWRISLTNLGRRGDGP